MNYYGAKELADSFRTVRKNTVTIAEEIDEKNYNFRPAPESRTVAQLLVHLATSSTKMQHQIHGVERRKTLEGFDFPAAMTRIQAEEQKPRTKAQIVALLHEDGESFAKWLQGLSDEFLGERVSMPAGGAPVGKTRFEMILGTKEHEMHHRGQLMVIERILGMVPHLTRERQAAFAARAPQKAQPA